MRRLESLEHTSIKADPRYLELGQCLLDALPLAQKDLQLELTRRHGEGWKVPPIPAEVFNVDADDREWVRRQCTMQPIDCFRQPLKPTGGIQKIKITFILATGWEGSPFPPFFEKAKRSGWKTLTLPCGHDVMLDLPDELTKALVEVI